MATMQLQTTYECPGCEATVAYDGRSWQCDSCGHAPYHSAD